MFVRSKKSGFTLVEILIVVIILGILAAIVIPQFTNASQDARKNSLTSQLQTLQSQVELWKLNHHDQLPDLTGANGWQLLTEKTDEWGALNAAGAFGPYMQTVPINPLNNLSNIVDGTGAPGAAAAFVYDYNAGAGSGKIWGTDQSGTALFVP